MNPTKTDVESFVNRISDKELIKGQFVTTLQYRHFGTMELIKKDFKTRHGDWQVLCNDSTFYQNEAEMTPLGKPILLGDVVFRIKDLADRRSLVETWRLCGNKSIQKIIADSGWETITLCGECGEEECGCNSQKFLEEEQLKSPEARELLSCLINLNLE